MTLIEVMVAIGIVVLLLGAVTVGLGKVRRTDLREDSAKLASAMRSAFDRAAVTGAHHRLVLDLDEQTFHVERCEGPVRLRRNALEEKADEGAELEAQQRAVLGADATSVSSPDAQQAAAAALAIADNVGHAACAPAKGPMGVPQSFKKKRGIHVSRVFVAHMDEAVTSGTVTLHFFPLGRAERAVVEVSNDDDDVFTLLVHPVSGRVEILPGPFKHPEEFVREDAEGKEVTP